MMRFVHIRRSKLTLNISLYYRHDTVIVPSTHTSTHRPTLVCT